MMMLMIILFVSLFVILAVLTFFRNVLATMIAAVLSIFRKGDKKRNKQNEPRVRHSNRRKKKIYADNEGEYVEYEEVN